MESVTLPAIWAVIAWIAAAIVLLANAAGKIAAIIQAAKAPNVQQNDRLDALEKEMEQVQQYLANDKKHLDSLDDGNRITQRALLALLSHGLDGNSIEQMEAAKAALEEHLINR